MIILQNSAGPAADRQLGVWEPQGEAHSKITPDYESTQGVGV